MKSLFAASILILVFCVALFAQTNQNAPCPTISVTGFAGIPNPAEAVIFTAEIGQGAETMNLLLDWKTNKNGFIDGQGTKQVKILWEEICNNNLIVTLEVSGLPKNCQNTYSETMSISCCLIQQIQIDEFSSAVNQIDKIKLNNLTKESQKNPNAQIYIIEKFEKHTSLKLIELKSQKTIDYLTTQGIERNTITLLNSLGDENLTEFILLPLGASSPNCDDCLEFRK